MPKGIFVRTKEHGHKISRADRVKKHREQSKKYYYTHRQERLNYAKKHRNPERDKQRYIKNKDKLCIDCGKFIDRRSTRCQVCVSKIRKVIFVGKKYPGQTRSVEQRKKISESLMGKLHWNWKGGRTKINKLRLSHQGWRRKRIECCERDNNRCQVCGFFPKRLEVHHIIPWRISHDDRLENLITLCKKCHKKLEANYGKNTI